MATNPIIITQNKRQNKRLNNKTINYVANDIANLIITYIGLACDTKFGIK